MPRNSTPPQNANDFIERALDERAKALMEVFSADVLALNSPLLYLLDAAVRDIVEHMGPKRGRRRRGKLVIVLTTAGGYIEVVQRIVETLRYHYRMVDFVIPDFALSAGTVLAMSGDAIHMNYFSRLGPIDPQVRSSTGQQVSAMGYLIQWERLLEKARLGTLTAAEASLMMTRFDPGDLYQYEQARELSVELLKEWLVRYKFKNWRVTETRKIPVTRKMKTDRADKIGRALNDPDQWHSHSSGISMEVLRRKLKLLIDDYDENQAAANRIRDYHVLMDDYMGRRRQIGALHAVGQYVPFLYEEEYGHA